ncbi:hypothetical protein D1872_259300 [compost metagenome]
MTRVTRSISSGVSASFLIDVVIIPTPIGLVKINRSPGLAPALVLTLSGWTSPVTARPNFGSLSSMEWPPTNVAPASFTLSAAPRRMSARMLLSRVEMGKATILSTVSGFPPMA